jgi:hypothetical protein
LREERWLKVFENRVLIFGSRRDEVTGDWRKLHNEEVNDLYCSIRLKNRLQRRYHVTRDAALKSEVKWSG